MATVLIVCASRTGETNKIGALIGEGIRLSGQEAKVCEVNDIKSEKDLVGYDGYLFGAATYHGEMLPTMKKLLFLAEKADLKGKPGGAFGAFGWSGEAPGRIFETMQHIFEMDMVSNPLKLKSSSLGGGITMAQDYGREIVKKLG